jgi:2-phosphosulfolactate phosphatase
VPTSAAGSAGRRLRVLTTQEAIRPEQITNSAVVVVDVLLATTTLIAALESGARRVFAAADLDDVERICATLNTATIVRGGEQNALPVEGFDCGAYPYEYGREVVRGKDVVYVSTNGTRAIAAAAGARRILVGNLRNAPAVGRFLADSVEESVVLVCAGARGGFSLEDFAATGVILSHLGAEGWRLNDAAWLALDLVCRDPDRVPELTRRSRTGRWFVSNHRTDVLDFAGDVGASDIVAEVRGGELVKVAGR